MTIDLLAALRDDGNSSGDRFESAIFLTYTLNLRYFEQIILPELARAGITRIVIISDERGYRDALELGLRGVEGIGRQYVCAPVHSLHHGLQHAKVVLLSGPRRGRLLVGSGNLTMQGWTRNLEAFCRFDHEEGSQAAVERYPFVTIWDLLRNVRPHVSEVARHMLDNILEHSQWLGSPAPLPPDLRVWTTTEVPVLRQLEEWRQGRGLGGHALKSLTIVSPFFDSDLGTIKRLFEDYLPDEASVFLDPTAIRLHVGRLRQSWPQNDGDLLVASIRRAAPGRLTPLHAKAIVGVEDGGSWCLLGSANATWPALMSAWSNRGNLECVVFQWSDRTDAFDQFLADPSISTDAIAESTPTIEPDSAMDLPSEPGITLTDLSLRGDLLAGMLSTSPNASHRQGVLELQRSGVSYSVSVDGHGHFEIGLPARLKEAESGRIRLGDLETPWRWIDQIDELERAGERGYHSRIRSSLETFDGSGRLFEDLINLLLNRHSDEVWSNEREHPPGQGVARPRGPTNEQGDSSPVDEPVPPASQFFAPEDVTRRMSDYVGEHLANHERSYASLRELLAIVLARLTLEQSGDSPSQGDRPTADSLDSPPPPEPGQTAALEHLVNYIGSYCGRYARHLSTADSVRDMGPAHLLRNHATLAWVLHDIGRRAEEEFDRLSRKTFWQVWAPLLQPSMIGLQGAAAMDVAIRSGGEVSLAAIIKREGIRSLFGQAILDQFGLPAAWTLIPNRDRRLADLLAARTLCRKLLSFTNDLVPDRDELTVFREFDSELHRIGEALSPTFDAATLSSVLRALRDFKTTPQRKYGAFENLRALERSGQRNTLEYDQLRVNITHFGVEADWELFRSSNVAISEVVQTRTEDALVFMCGACYMEIPDGAARKLDQGRLVMCPNCHDRWNYWSPPAPKRVWLD